MTTPADVAHLPYRPCVGVALFNRAGMVWTGRRNHQKHDVDSPYRWQLPQGGIDPGEKPEQAAFRELWEEAGTRQAEILAKAGAVFTYDYPAEVLSAAKRNRWRGQAQHWFAMLYTGTEDLFDLEVHHPEFDAWEWRPLETIPELIIPFKRAVYEQVVAAFTPIAQRLAREAGA